MTISTATKGTLEVTMIDLHRTPAPPTLSKNPFIRVSPSRRRPRGTSRDTARVPRADGRFVLPKVPENNTTRSAAQSVRREPEKKIYIYTYTNFQQPLPLPNARMTN